MVLLLYPICKSHWGYKVAKSLNVKTRQQTNMVAARMTEMTNLDIVIEANVKKMEFELYCSIDRSCVSEKLALGDFLKNYVQGRPY